jgi:hypothetical protein
MYTCVPHLGMECTVRLMLRPSCTTCVVVIKRVNCTNQVGLTICKMFNLVQQLGNWLQVGPTTCKVLNLVQ